MILTGKFIIIVLVNISWEVIVKSSIFYIFLIRYTIFLIGLLHNGTKKGLRRNSLFQRIVALKKD